MNIIDFENFALPTGISKKHYVTGDARETIANLIYLNVGGIKAHHLAFKIYESKGPTEYTDDEVAIIMKVANFHCLPNVLDGLNEQLNKE